MVAVPVIEPIPIAVAAPKALTVVAVAFNRLNVAAVVVRSPPSIFRSPKIWVFPVLVTLNCVVLPI